MRLFECFIQIDYIKELFTNDLTGIQALGNLSEQMASLSWNIESLLTDYFTDLCTSYFRGSSPIDEYSQRLTNYIVAFLRKRRLTFVRVIVNESLRAINQHIDQESNTFSQSSVSSWTAGLQNILLTILSSSNRFKIFTDSVNQVIKSEEESSFLSDGVRDKVVDDLMVVYHEYCNHSIKLTGDFINMATQHPGLGNIPIKDISAIHNVVTCCVGDLDTSFIKISSFLRFKISEFMSKYTKLFHDQCLASICSIVSAEKWRLVDCPSSIHQFLHSLESYSGAASTNMKCALLGNKSYILTNSSIHVLQTISMYLTLVELLPCLGTIAAINCAEFIKTFNLQCYRNLSQTASSKINSLNNVRGSVHTVQIIGICCCTIELIGKVISPIETLFSHFASPSDQQIMAHFVKLKQDITKHQNELDKKLYNLVCSPVFNEIQKWDKKEGNNMNSILRSTSQHLRRCHLSLSGIVTKNDFSNYLIRLFEMVNNEVRDMDSNEDTCVAFIQGFRVEISQYLNIHHSDGLEFND